MNIDDSLKKIVIENKYKLLWIPYDEFENIKKIGEGGFSTVFCALWDDKSRKTKMTVALKLLHGSNDCTEEFINELKPYCDIRLKQPSFLRSLGISRDDVSRDYILVMQYE